MKNEKLKYLRSMKGGVKMNSTRIISLLVVTLMIFSIPFALAQDEDSEVEVVDAGITPDSPFYGLDNALDRIRLALIFDKAKRSERALLIAEERLAEVREMIRQKKDSHADRARERHKEFLDKANKDISDLETNGDDKRSEKALTRLAVLQDKIESHKEKVAEVHARILEEKADELSDEEFAHLEEVFAKIEERISNAEDKVLEKKGNAKTKYKVVSGKSDEEVEAFVEEIESEALIKAQERRVERAEKRSERFIKIHEGRVARAQERLDNNENLPEEQRTRIQKHMDRSNEKLDFFREKSDQRIVRARDKLEEARLAKA